ncbi:MAG: hypothetical protein D3925_11850 [Candidatus Electrothrix sp. AR5]|nr:hypothetical protein [Candidatus Electrothrix sp. AR5]
MLGLKSKQEMLLMVEKRANSHLPPLPSPDSSIATFLGIIIIKQVKKYSGLQDHHQYCSSDT